LSQAGRDHIAVLALIRDLTPSAIAVADLDASSGRDQRDRCIVGPRPAPQIDVGVHRTGGEIGLRRGALRRCG
jgi:hypothetical protein